MSHGPGCGGKAVVRVQGRGRKEDKVKTKGERGRVIVQEGGGRGSNGEVVSKEISVRILVAYGHDIWLTRKQVTVVPCCVSSLLTMSILGSPACE